MQKRDIVRNINKLTTLMDAKVLIAYSKYRGCAVSSSIRIIKFENCLDGVFTYSYKHWRTNELITDISMRNGVRSLSEAGGVSLTAKMIKYLLKIAVIVDTDSKLSFNLDTYKMWCEKYNLPISEKVTSL